MSYDLINVLIGFFIGLLASIVVMAVYFYRNSDHLDLFRFKTAKESIRLHSEEWVKPETSWLGIDSPAEVEAEIELLEKLAKLEETIQGINRRALLSLVIILVFGLIMLFTLFIIILDGFRIGGFELDQTSANILAGSLLVEVIGLVGLQLRVLYHFPEK